MLFQVSARIHQAAAGVGPFLLMMLPAYADGFSAATLTILLLGPPLWLAVTFLSARWVAGHPSGGVAGTVFGASCWALMAKMTLDSKGLVFGLLFVGPTLGLAVALLVATLCRLALMFRKSLMDFKAQTEKEKADAPGLLEQR